MLIQQNQTAGVSCVCSLIGSNPAPVTYSVAKNGANAVGGGGLVTGEALGGSTNLYVAHVSLSAGDTDTLGQLLVVVQDGSGQSIGQVFAQVVPWNPDDGNGLGLTNLDAPISTVIAGLATALTDLGTVLTDLGTLATGVSGVPVALLDLAAGIETGFTLRQGLRVLSAALAGKIAIVGTTVTIRSINDTKNRIICTVDGTGQRLSFTFDLT